MHDSKRIWRVGLNAILLGAAVLVSHVALAASFDCDHAVTKMEQMICSDPALSRQDEQLAAVYERALRATGDPQAIRNQQREWLADTARNCDSVACLKSAYALRINQLGAITPPAAATASFAAMPPFEKASAGEHCNNVPDAKAAARVAEAVLVKKFGKERVAEQLPLHVESFRKDFWLAQGTLKGIHGPGGNFGVVIDKGSGCVRMAEYMK